MKLFRNASIQRKQTLIIMLTAAVALLLACAAFAAYEVITFRKAMLRNLVTLGEIIGDNSAAAMDFNNPKDAEDTLAALKAEPNIVGACIYLKSGQLFAVYDRAGDQRTFVPPKFRMTGHSFGRNDLILFDPIDYKGDVIGSVCLVSDMHALYSRLEQYAVIVTVVFLVAMLVALLISGRLQRLISGPILHLVQTARAVAQDKNYSLRAVKTSQDELGVLVDGFNAMLTQIQEHDEALQAAHQHLEQRVAERTKELASSVSLMNATLEASADGILVVDRDQRIGIYNAKFVEMWRLPEAEVQSKADERVLPLVVNLLKDPETFLRKVRELYRNPDAESDDILELQDGRIFERHSQPQRLNGECVGRVWCFRDITERKRSEAELENAHRQLIDTSRQAGMAEVATSVLHNVGNVLNSVNISSSLVSDKIRKSRVSNLAKAVALMQAHKDDLAGFFGADAKGRQLPEYLANLSVHLADEQEEILQELSLLNGNIEHIKEIVAMQQSYARVSGVLESLKLADLMEDALRMNAGALDRHQVRVVREFDPALTVTVEKHKVLQILVNLIRNAKYALDDGMPAEKQMTLRFAASGNDQVSISVIDNGVGIPAENLTRIFGHGFTTRKAGHGFGLHSGALAARELGGSLTAQSDGPGKGACFTLEFPREPNKK